MLGWILGYLRLIPLLLCVGMYLLGVFAATGGIAFFFAYPVYLFGFPTLATILYLLILLGFFINYLYNFSQRRKRSNIAESLVVAVVKITLPLPDSHTATEKDDLDSYLKPSNN